MHPWVGKGAMATFIKSLTDDSLDEAMKQGLSLDKPIESRAEADNSIIMTVPLNFLASFFIRQLDLTLLMRLKLFISMELI